MNLVEIIDIYLDINILNLKRKIKFKYQQYLTKCIIFELVKSIKFYFEIQKLLFF